MPRKSKKSKRGGGGSDYRHSFHAAAMHPRALSKVTRAGLANTPMFNPMKSGTRIATGTGTGIIPTGAYMHAESLLGGASKRRSGTPLYKRKPTKTGRKISKKHRCRPGPKPKSKGKKPVKTIGSRAEVMHCTAKKTSGGLTKYNLDYNKQGKIVSRKASNSAKRAKNLIKAGYKTKKGQFGSFKA